MTADTPDDSPAPDAVPVARIRPRRRWTSYLFWLVPLAAAIFAGYLVYSRMHEYGPPIRIMFRDATGLKPGQSEIRFRGVTVGDVTDLGFTPDNAYVVVSARVRREAADIARTGSVFWIVRPEVGIETVRGLGTVISGPYIDVLPGSGAPKSEFIGVERPSPALGRSGLSIVLATAQFGSIRPRTAVTYRGIEVGMVTSSTLSRDASVAHVHALVEPRYARLVRIGSRFWTAGGVDVNLSLFKGLEVSIESLRSLVAGGVAFATPDAESPAAKDGATFVLHEKPEKEWLTWAPKIAITPAP